MKKRNKRLVCGMILVLALAMAGCGSDSETSSSDAENTTSASSTVSSNSEIETSDSSAETSGIPAQEDTSISSEDKNNETSPEEYMDWFIRAYYIDGTEDPETMWDNCVSEKSKSLNLITQEDYLSNIKETLFKYDYTDVIITSSEEVAPDIYKVSYTYKYNDGGVDDNASESLYVIKEDDRYKLLISGVTDAYSFDDNAADDEFNLTNIRVYCTVEGIQINYDFNNYSSRKIYMGPWGSTLLVTMTSDDGSQYSAGFQNMIVINPNNYDSEQLYFSGASGRPVELNFETITYEGSNGLPDGTTSYSVTLNY